jgi:hypothetical protein
MSIKDEIKNRIKNELGKISEAHVKSWISERLIDPIHVKLALDSNGKNYESFWLVSTHKNDKGYRIAYDEKLKMFGIVTILENGIEWFMGCYGSFDETVNNL